MFRRIAFSMATLSAVLTAAPAFALPPHSVVKPRQTAISPQLRDRLVRELLQGIAQAQARAAANHLGGAATRAEIQSEIQRIITASGLEPEVVRAALIRVQQDYKGCVPAVMFYEQFSCAGDVLGALGYVQAIVLAELEASNPSSTGGSTGPGLIAAPVLPDPNASSTSSYLGAVPG